MIMTRGARPSFKKLTHEPLCGALISSALNQNVENEAVLIDGAPKPLLFAADRNDDLVERL